MKREKWNRVFLVLLAMVTVRITSAGLRRETCGKRRCRNHYSVFMEHKAV